MKRQAFLTVIPVYTDPVASTMQSACLLTEAIGPYMIAAWALQQVDPRMSIGDAQAEVQRIQAAGHFKHDLFGVFMVRADNTAVIVSTQVY